MAEENQAVAEPTPAVPEPTVVPDQIDDATFADLMGLPRETPEPKPAPKTEVKDAPSPVSEKSSDDRLSQLENQNRQLAGMVQAMLAQGQQGGNKNQSQPLSMEDRIKTHFPDVDPSQLKPLAGLMKELVGEAVSPLQQAVQQQQYSLTQRQQQEIRQDFNAFIDKEMNDLKVESPAVRRMLRNSVVQDGLERYGNDFSKEIAANLLRSQHGEYLRDLHAREESINSREEQDADNTAPVRTSQSATSAAEGIRKRLLDPKDKKMDLRGPDFNKLVGAFVNRITG